MKDSEMTQISEIDSARAEIEHHANGWIVTLSSAVDPLNFPDLVQKLSAAATAATPDNLLLCLDHVDYLQSSAISHLVTLRNRLSECGIGLQLTGLHPCVLEALESLNLQQILATCPDKDTAMRDWAKRTETDQSSEKQSTCLALEQRDGVVVVRVPAQPNEGDIEPLQRELATHLNDWSKNRVVLDLSAMSHVEPASIDQLAAIHRQVVSAGCECSACHPSRNFSRIAQSRGLPVELRVTTSVASAVNSV